MRERWKGFGIAGAFALLGLGVAVWLVTGRPEPESDARLLLAVLFGGFAVWCFCGNSRAGEVRSFGLGLGMLIAMSGGAWVYMIESRIWGGLLRLRGSAWERFWESWETACVYLLPVAGMFVAVNILGQAARTVVKRIAGERGRKKSESELFGKAKFLERRWLRELAKNKGVMLGQSRDGLIAYPLEGSAMTFAPPRTGKGATIALNYLSPEERGWQGSTVMHLAMERSRRVGKEEGGSNFTTVSNQLSFLNYPEVAAHTSSSSFDPLDLANGDMDVFVVVPDEMTGLVKGWLRLWISIPYAVASRRAMQRDMLVVIDELPALGHLQPVMDGYNLAAGKGVHFWTFAQSVSALDETWGADSRKTLMHLAEVVQVLGWPRMDVEGAEVLSKAIGAATFENRSESRSGQIREATLLPEGQGSIQESLSVVKEQLVSSDEILSMGPDDQFVIASPKDMPRDVIGLKHARYWMLKNVGTLADPNPYVIRKERTRLEAA